MVAPGYPAPSAHASAWRAVHTGLVLVLAGLAIVAGANLLNVVLRTATLADVISGRMKSAAALERLQLLAKVFPFFVCAGLAVAIAGAAGLARTPPPGRAATLAVVALCAGALALLIDGGQWAIRVVDDRASVLHDLERRPVALTVQLALALFTATLALSIEASLRRAGAPGARPLVIAVLALTALCAIWLSYLTLAQPRWHFPSRHPWAWMVILHVPVIARTALLAAVAGVGAGQLRRAAPR